MNKKEYRFRGVSHEGNCDFVFCCGSEEVAQFWLDFLAESRELRSCSTTVINTFLSLAVADVPSFLLETSGRVFLLEKRTLHDWLFYWKHLGHPFPEYFCRRIMHLVIATIRYCIDKNPSFCNLPPILVDIIRGKEFATFIMKEWDGYGVVAVTRTTGTRGVRTLIREFHFRNPALGHLYMEYYQSGFASVRSSEFNRFSDEFEDSFEEMAQDIKSFADLSEATLFRQVNYFRKKYLMEPKVERQALRHVVGFYRYVVDTEEGCHIFDNGNFSPNLLKTMTVIQYLADGWETISYRSIGESETRTRLIVVFKGVRNLGTRFVNGDTIAVNLSVVESDFYRNLIWRYIRMKTNVILNPSNISQLADALHIIESMKRRRGDDYRLIRNSDTKQLYAVTLGRDISDQTVIGTFNLLRNFFEWAVMQNYLKAEADVTLNILHYRAEGVYPTMPKVAIPREDVQRILDRFKMEAGHSHRGLLIYTIVTMLATTQFRPSQICIIRPRDIQLFKDRGFCVINGVTKTSCGDMTRCITSPDTYDLLVNVIANTAEIRETCYNPVYRDLLFIYRGSNGWKRLTEHDVKEEIARVCDALDLPRYTTKPFRKMYATVLDEYDRLLGYHGELAAQMMNHRDKRTTREHYIDRSFQEFQRVENAAAISTDDMMRMEYEQLCKEGKI